MSATEAQLGLAPEFEFEFEFDLKFNDRVRVRVRVPGSSFRVPASGFQFRVPFPGSVFGPFSGPFRGPFSVPFEIPEKDKKRTTLSNGVIPTIARGIARENAGLAPSGTIAQSPSHSLSHPSEGFARTPSRTAAARASVIFLIDDAPREGV